MTSNREKGQVFQREVAAWLGVRGWSVYSSQQKPCRVYTGACWVSGVNDPFGADIIARRGRRLLWIQATRGTNVTRKVDNFRMHFSSTLPGEEVHVWLRASARRWRLKIVRFDEGFIDVRDLGEIIDGKFLPDANYGVLYAGF